MSEDLLQIAKVLKSNGTEGGVLLGFRDISPEDISLEEPVFIEFDGLPVPFFFTSFERKGNGKAIAKLTDITSLRDAEEIVGRAVYAEEDSILGDDDDDELTLDDLVGWTLYDGERLLGEVTGIEDIPGNPCLYVDVEGQEAMVPFHEDFIISVEEETEVIVMDLPEGLL